MSQYGFDQEALGTKYSTGSASLYGSGLDQASQKDIDLNKEEPFNKKAAMQGAAQSMNAGGSAGQVVTSAGLATMNPWLIGGGLALTAVEGNQKAKAMDEAAKVKEAETRKIAVQNALNSSLNATRQLGV
jgi:hypothetical protein